VGFSDPDGRLRLAPKFDELDEFDGGMAAASLDGKAGFISIEGQWIIEPRYDKCFRFVGDLAVVQSGDTYSLLSRSGAVVWTSEPYAMPQTPPLSE
jgi:hypothetical protein